MIYILLYLSISVSFLYTSLTNLELFKKTIGKADLKARKKSIEELNTMKKDLILVLVWPYLIFKKFKSL